MLKPHLITSKYNYEFSLEVVSCCVFCFGFITFNQCFVSHFVLEVIIPGLPGPVVSVMGILRVLEINFYGNQRLRPDPMKQRLV